MSITSVVIVFRLVAARWPPSRGLAHALRLTLLLPHPTDRDQVPEHLAGLVRREVESAVLVAHTQPLIAGRVVERHHCSKGLFDIFGSHTHVGRLFRGESYNEGFDEHA